MINYSRTDQSNYATERSQYLCLSLGIPEERVTRDNYDSIRELAMVLLTGDRRARTLNELASLLMFDVTIGYGDTDG